MRIIRDISKTQFDIKSFLVRVVNSTWLHKVILFANDTNLFFSNNYPNELIKTLNSEIPKFSHWFTVNKLTLNIDKTKLILFKL